MTKAEKVADWKRRNRAKVMAQRTRYRLRKSGVSLHDAHVRVWAQQIRRAKRIAFPSSSYFVGPHLSARRAYQLRYRCDVEFRLKERLRRQLRKKAEAVPGMAEMVRRSLRATKSREGSPVEQVIGYSINQLRTHLERQFKRGMTWATFGKEGWHIDHILPRRCFDVSTPEGLREYWSLTNLRPLPARDNLKKGARVEFLL